MPENDFRVFGIDLGTTYSAISYVDETGRPTVCRNTDGVETTPSVVYFENESNVVVGSVAKNSATVSEERVLSLIKRRMGDDAVYEFDGVAYSPESVSALILKQLAQDAQMHVGEQASRAVITVPAYFGMLERSATKDAGEIAGLDVVNIVPEPVAAAMHYDAVSDGAGRTILVYDLGGGTFDTTVIQVGEDAIDVLCTDGDDSLGGADWDERLSGFLLEKFTEQVPPDFSPEEDEEFKLTLLNRAEETKKQLSQAESRPVALRGGGASARVEVTREDFENQTADLLDRTMEIVKRTLEALEQKRPGAAVDEVLLVGGSTKMPAVSRRLREEFGWQPRLHDPDLAVAKGAALFALGQVLHREKQDAQDSERSPDDVVSAAAAQTGISAETLETLAAKRTRHVLPKAFGIRLVDTSDPDWETDPEKHFYVKHMVNANDQLPTEESRLPVVTLHEGQTAVDVALYEQSGSRAGPGMDENKPVNEGRGTIQGLPPLPAGSPLDVRMTVDEEGLLQLTATEPSTQKSLDLQVRVSVRSGEEVDEAKKAVAGIAVSS